MNAMTGLIHFVGYQLRPDLDDAKIERVRSGFAGLVKAVPDSSLLAIGPNISHSSFAAGWDYAAIVGFDGTEALQAYIAHPLHKALGAETSDGFYRTCIVLDIKTGEGGAT